jgi:DUF3096 family protein
MKKGDASPGNGTDSKTQRFLDPARLSWPNNSAKTPRKFRRKKMDILAAVISVQIGPVLALVAGILILLVPRLLSFIVAIYLIIIGLSGLLHLGL